MSSWLLLAATAYADTVKDVNVVNTVQAEILNTQDVSVIGTVPVTLDQLVDVNVTSPTDVNVLGIPGVTIENLNPIPVATTTLFPREAIGFNESYSFFPGGKKTQSSILYTVPSGKRLVIETASAQVSVPDGEEPVYVSIGGLSLPTIRQGSDGTSTYFSGLEQFRKYIPEDSNVSALVIISGLGSSGISGFASLSVSGYLLPMESPTLSP